MQKLEFDFILDEQQKKYKEDLTQFLLQQQVIQDWMQDHQVDERFVYDYCGTLNEYFKVMDKCNKCQGLALCSQPMKGMRRELMIEENLLLPVHVNCTYQKQEDQRNAHKDNYWIFDFPKPYLYIDLWDIDISKENKDYTVAMMKAMGIISQNKSKGLYLWGVPGVGKTYLLAGMCNQLAKQGKKVCFVNVPKLIGDLKQMFQDNDALERYIRRIIRCDVLVLDDIGSESATAWSRDEIILMILDQRMEKQKLTCFSSNYSGKELHKKYAFANKRYEEKVAAQRILERIQVLSTEHFIKGETRRK